MNFVTLQVLSAEQRTLMFKNYEAELNECIDAIDNGNVEKAYSILYNNPYVREGISNNSENTVVRIFRLGYLGEAGKKIFDMMVQSVHETKRDRIFGGNKIEWENILEWAKRNAKREPSEIEKQSIQLQKSQREEREMDRWLIDSVLSEILTSEKPNFKNLYHIIPGVNIDNMDIETYYSLIFDFIRKRHIPAELIITCLIKNPGYLYYFLSGNEFEMYFREYFDALNENQRQGFFTKILESQYKTDDELLDIRYLARRLRNREVDSLLLEETSESDLQRLKKLSKLILDTEEEIKYRILEQEDTIFRRKVNQVKKKDEELDDEEYKIILEEAREEVQEFRNEIIVELEQVTREYSNAFQKFFER